MENEGLFNSGFWGDALRGLRQRTLDRRAAHLAVMTRAELEQAKSDAPLPTVGPGATALTPYERHWIAERMHDRLAHYAKLEEQARDEGDKSAAAALEQKEIVVSLARSRDEFANEAKKSADETAIFNAAKADELHGYAVRALDTHVAQQAAHAVDRASHGKMRELLEPHMEEPATFEDLCAAVFAHISAEVSEPSSNAAVSEPAQLPANVDA